VPSITTIQVALHYAQSEADYPRHSAAVTRTLEDLLRNGLIEERPGGYRRTAALTHWVRTLTRVPFPVIE
jgi:hypothetical protein